ncbi:OLC1v1033011C1 [Oldenlandia corymbosa var. corymbosa]|uniref:OLC1v1033011C1 n=1 Tax=Oldenlandia corymbosa var. corymbosa TaxID=529605 RepID=A0AAV1CN36_OLDCO|nr:OLC1v1033011C1 [Oldenlandia corymbosa var. corymbosa]
MSVKNSCHWPRLAFISKECVSSTCMSFTVYPVVGVSLSNAKSFIEDVKNLVALQPEAFCGIDVYGGMLLRYVKASSAYLGKDEDALELDVLYYRSKDPMAPRLHQDFYDEIEQIALFKYGGIPHWGKNKNMAFVGAIHKYGIQVNS